MSYQRERQWEKVCHFSNQSFEAGFPHPSLLARKRSLMQCLTCLAGVSCLRYWVSGVLGAAFLRSFGKVGGSF